VNVLEASITLSDTFVKVYFSLFAYCSMQSYLSIPKPKSQANIASLSQACCKLMLQAGYWLVIGTLRQACDQLFKKNVTAN
jgi:hypothetical protein